MKSIEIIDGKPITLLEIEDILDVNKRLKQIQNWETESKEEIAEIYERIDALGSLDNHLDQQTSYVLVDLLKNAQLKKMHEPILIPDDLISKYSEFKEKLNSHYKNMKEKEEKLAWLSNLDFFITPPLFKLLERLEHKSRYHLLVGGESRSGKTTIFKWLNSQYKPELYPTYTSHPFIHVESSTDMHSLKPFYQRLIMLLGGKYKRIGRGSSEPELLNICTGLMTSTRTQYVVIDQIGNWGIETIQKRLIEFTNSAPPKLRTVGVSVNPISLTTSNDELTGRFGMPYMLDTFTNKKLINLLCFFDLILPFTVSDLHVEYYENGENKTPGMMQVIQAKTDGVLGNIVDLVKNAAIATINDGKKDCIDPERLVTTWNKMYEVTH